MNANLRDNLLITAGLRAGYMDAIYDINLHGGVDGEDDLSRRVVEFVDRYIEEKIDISFDEYIETFLLQTYPNGKSEEE